MLIIIGFGLLVSPSDNPENLSSFNVDMSIRDIAPTLNVTGKALARELKLPIDVSKKKPLKTMGVTPEELQHVTEHLLSHRDSMLKYYVYVALVLGGLVFLALRILCL